MVDLITRFDAAYSNLTSAMVALADAEADLVDAERILTERRFALLLTNEPKQLGANEEIRSAVLAQMTEKERFAVQAATDTRNQVRLQFEICKLELDAVKGVLRIMEAMTERVNTHLAR